MNLSNFFISLCLLASFSVQALILNNYTGKTIVIELLEKENPETYLQDYKGFITKLTLEPNACIKLERPYDGYTPIAKISYRIDSNGYYLANSLHRPNYWNPVNPRWELEWQMEKALGKIDFVMWDNGLIAAIYEYGAEKYLVSTTNSLVHWKKL